MAWKRYSIIDISLSDATSYDKVWYFFLRKLGGTSLVDFFLSCGFFAFVRVCLYVPCGHLLGWPLGSCLCCLNVSLLLSHCYGTWLYRFLIFAPLLTLIASPPHIIGPRVRASPASLRCGPWARHIYPSLVLVQPRKTVPHNWKIVEWT